MLTWSSPTDNKSNPPLCRITRCVLFGKRIVWNITDPEEERAQVLSEWLNSCFKCLTVFLFQADPFMCHSDTWNTHVFSFLNQNKAYCHRTAMHYGLFPLSSVWRVAKLRQWPVRVQTVKACRALKQSAHSPHALQMYVDLENEETKRHDGKKNIFFGVCRLYVTLELRLRDSCVACHCGGTEAHAHKQTDAIRCDGSTAMGLRPHGRVFRCLWGSDGPSASGSPGVGPSHLATQGSHDCAHLQHWCVPCPITCDTSAFDLVAYKKRM